MNRVKTAPAAAVGGIVGVVALRAVRKQQTPPQTEAKNAARSALTEAEAAAEHAAAAVRQARIAGEKTVETARTEYDIGAAATDEDGESADGRLRRVGTDWVRG